MLRYLAANDAERAERALNKLLRHDVANWALAGGLAVEVQCKGPGPRALNDIDFVCESFEEIPPSLARDFLFRHVHPLETRGRTMLQMIDQETALRIDVFQACGESVKRARAAGGFRVLAAEDLLARTVRVLMDVVAGAPTAAKHAHDYSRLAALTESSAAETAWRDHRQPQHPPSFADASNAVAEAIARRRDLLTAPSYSNNPDELCPRCIEDQRFPLADARLILSILGYC